MGLRIENLKEIVATTDICLKDMRVVIALPSSVYKEDRELCDIQQRDADALAGYLMNNIGSELVSIIIGSNSINDLANSITSPYECVIFLHEAMVFESIVIISILTKYNKNLKYFNLY